MTIISVVSHIKAKAALTKVITDEIENVAGATVQSMSSWINSRMLDVGNWSKQGAYKKALISSFLGMTARSFANEDLLRIKSDYGYYQDILLADGTGEIVAASDPSMVGKANVSDRIYFQKALAGHTFVTEHVLNSRVSDNLVTVISAPVKDGGKVTGVLFALFDVNSIAGQFIDGIRIGKGGFAFLFLEKGYIVCNSPSLAICGDNIASFDFGKKMMQQREGSLDVELGGVSMTAAFKRLESMNWTIVVCAVKDEVFSPVRTLGRINSIVTILVALIVCVVFVMITISVSRPIKDVMAGLRQMGSGRLDYRLRIRNRDEIGQIGQALNRMAKNLEASDKKIKKQNLLLIRARDELEQRVEQRTLALRQAEEKYRGIFENAMEGIFQGTLDGRIISANPSLAKIFGYGSVEKMFADQKTVLFPVSKKEAIKIRQVLAQEGRVVSWETAVRQQNGRWIWCSLSASQIVNEETEEGRCEGFVVDITERRERERVQHEYRAARAANRAKSEFLANMSHEIRTPLNTLLGFSELLAVDLNDPKQESYIEAMRLAGRNLLTLINDILDLSKIEAGKMEFRLESVNLKVLCSEMEYIFKDKIERKKIEFIISLSQNLPEIVLLDETRVRQIMLNLVGNAVKFSAKGRITLNVECGESNNSDHIDLIIEVQDTGPGIADDHQTVIFESFKQVDGQITRKYGGTGLGLAICKRLTEAMNGEIRLQSRLGQGSLFQVLLKDVPYGERSLLAVDSTYSDRTGGASRFEKHKVLVVDDTAANRIMLKELLCRFNQDVIEAEDGQHAITMARDTLPDLIIMDVRMPNLDGDIATQRLKSDPVTSGIPIIAFTADVVDKTKNGVLKKGYDGYLTKPVQIDDLKCELAKYFRQEAPGKRKQPETIAWEDFSNETINDPSGLREELEDNFLPQLVSFRSSVVINQVKAFSYDLKQLAVKHGVAPMQLYADQLTEAVDLFDITLIEKKMGELPLILNTLIQKL